MEIENNCEAQEVEKKRRGLPHNISFKTYVLTYLLLTLKFVFLYYFERESK